MVSVKMDGTNTRVLQNGGSEECLEQGGSEEKVGRK